KHELHARSPSTGVSRPGVDVRNQARLFELGDQVDTVVRERPVARAMSAWLIWPCIRRISITRWRLRSLSQARVPSPFFEPGIHATSWSGPAVCQEPKQIVGAVWPIT